jgi:hypothetical protein
MGPSIENELLLLHREVRDEALTASLQASHGSREIVKLIQSADTVSVAEGNIVSQDPAQFLLQFLRTSALVKHI